jgi:hypothetical protein
MLRILLIIGSLVAVLAAAACGSSATSSQTSTSPTPQIQLSESPVSGASYNPSIVPSNFTDQITNKYWPLTPGNTWVYDGTKDGVPQHVVVQVQNTSRTIAGVRCVVVIDTVTMNSSLEEKTTDWYAQDKQGNVWYFGEDSKDYKNGVVVSTAGTWETGVDGALPGIIVQSNPQTGTPTYRQEYRPGVAEDMARVISLSATQKVPAGTFHNTLALLDTDPLNPTKIEHKYYAPGVGPVFVKRVGSAHREVISLVKYSIK